MLQDTTCVSCYFTECSICLLGLRIFYLLCECVYTLDPQFACGFILCRVFYVKLVTDVQMKTLCSKVVFQGTGRDPDTTTEVNPKLPPSCTWSQGDKEAMLLPLN